MCESGQIFFKSLHFFSKKGYGLNAKGWRWKGCNHASMSTTDDPAGTPVTQRVHR
jgi:hypothetical protein